ncbi:dynamin family protein, partial [Paenibacillus thailandensis]
AAPYPPLAQAAAAMADKAARLASSRFTIALFGAFSAGKSSLANALIGEPVLPVSPNPTTAAINRLVPPTAERPHGTARVVMKSREAMLSDLRYSLTMLGEDASEAAMPDTNALLKAIDKLSPDAIRGSGRPHYSFLRAARAGWEACGPLLGSELDVQQPEYERYVAEESRSCFVGEIELHYACPLTDQGIVLVDTPGADSVNARHTGVAFNYIKNADAVLFVTYYNHAFSQADRQFLSQLGRVKDQFELDKMFFLVNAADLAADEEELDGVLKHVEQQLLQHGIRNPRLFPVSSLQALDAKLEGNDERLAASGVAQFERSFLSFVHNDLGRLAVDAAEREIRRAAAAVRGWLQSAEGDAASRQAEAERLKEQAEEAAGLIREFGAADTPAQLPQELGELLYYVAQRLQYRFGEMYNLAFNPSSLQDDGRDLRKAVWTAWLELTRYIRVELSQELQATTLRMEKALHGLLAKRHQAAAERIEALIEGYEAAAYASEPTAMPDEAPEWTPETVDAKWLWSRFKSPRQFFEGEGKGKLRGELEAIVGPSLQGWMSERIADWSAFYSGIWSDAVKGAALKLQEDLSAYVDGKLASLSDSADKEQLRSLHERFQRLLAPQ